MSSSESKLTLRISIGSSHSDTTYAYVNDPSKATKIKNDVFDGHVLVRVRDYKGLAPDNSEVKSNDTEYFSNTSDTSSVQFCGKILVDATGDDLLFGNDFDSPIKASLPPGTSLGLKALKWIDPSMETDLYADKPWAFSPLIATMNLLNTVDQSPASPDFTRVEEDTSNLVKEKINVKQRRAYFADATHRKAQSLHGLYLSADFSNPYIDFNSLSIALPYVNLHVDILKYWKGEGSSSTVCC